MSAPMAATTWISKKFYGFGIDTFQRGVLALSGGSDIEQGSTRFNFAFDVAEMTMMLHISSVYAVDTPLDTSMFLYTPSAADRAGLRDMTTTEGPIKKVLKQKPAE